MTQTSKTIILTLALGTSLLAPAREQDATPSTQAITNKIKVNLIPQESAEWHLKGDRPTDYAMNFQESTHGDPFAMRLRSVVPKATSYGVIRRSSSDFAKDFREKRIRLTAFIKTDEVSVRAGLWLRTDGRDNKILALDNMINRPIQGTTEWAQYSCVLDVSRQTTSIVFGLQLEGTGTAWIDGITLETVGPDVPTTKTR